MFRSIRWNLLSWYAVILLIVIGGFGATLYYALERSISREVQTRIASWAERFADEIDEENGKIRLDLSQDFLKDFRKDDDRHPYFALWDVQGRLVDRSPRAPATPPVSPPRKHGTRHEVIRKGPAGTTILVGLRAHEEKERIRELLGTVLGAGGAIMILGLIGGWFLTARALRPIRKMGEAAAAVSASNLSQRIDVGKTESELGQLAGTLNEAFDRLEKAFERQTRFTADASHELRTPLAIVMSQAELALRKERTPAEYREALETSLKASQRMKAVVEGLLTLARADAKELDLRKERVELGRLVEETASLLGPLALERKVSLTVSAEPVSVSGDPDRLREVVTNLITNAIRYNVQGGKVDVTLSGGKDGASLTFADTGIGIPEKDQPLLFERFYRVDKARSREAGGTGLGLAISKWIVEAHGGTISFASRENAGSTFTVRLPRAL